MCTLSSERVHQWLSEIRVLDGGFGTESRKLSNLQIDGHLAWSSRLLKEDPELVVEIHKSFLRAGSDVISTNTYQAAPATLTKALDITNEDAINLMRTAVDLAKRACKENSLDNSEEFRRKLPVLIAGSLGPYGACIADGSEYTGSYANKVSFAEIVEFHLLRAQILLESGVDFIAWETVPLLMEVSAICEVMRRLPSAYSWISVSSPDGIKTSGGDLLTSVAREVGNCEQVFGVGVNCNIPHNCIGKALANLNSYSESGNIPRKLLLFYANDGRTWIPNGDKEQGHLIDYSEFNENSWFCSTTQWAKRRETPSDEQYAVNNKPPLAQWASCRVDET
ncbi:Homocysteine S-methyltransferase 2 isoform 1 [Schistosoma japonicum]|uniref:Homocysteine S-methyltransferase 2 isoform 1 n=2 Tax=Schistosoma japonicum TaxID=6182 RepID=A0A4Z2CT33_SCHJA|nr:Homocysteine S-methyltransferase 2 isoform 1 [Schistosoma japonicum]